MNEHDTAVVDREVGDESAQEESVKKDSPMHHVVTESPLPPVVGDVVEGTVSAIGRARVYVDLPPFGSGIIYGREYMNARDILRKVSAGDIIAAKVVDAGNEDGYIELSLKEARQALIWSEAEAAQKKQTVISLARAASFSCGRVSEVFSLPLSSLRSTTRAWKTATKTKSTLNSRSSSASTSR